MPSFFASSVENLALAPVSSTATVRPRPDLVSAGSTAFFRSSAATLGAVDGGITLRLAVDQPYGGVLRLGQLDLLDRRLGGVAQLVGVEHRGASVPFSAAKVSDSAIISGLIVKDARRARLHLDRRRDGRLGDASGAPRAASSSVISGSVTSAGSSTGARRPEEAVLDGRRGCRLLSTVTPACAGVCSTFVPVVRQGRVLGRLVDACRPGPATAPSSLASSTTTRRRRSPTAGQHPDDLPRVEAAATAGGVDAGRA